MLSFTFSYIKEKAADNIRKNELMKTYNEAIPKFEYLQWHSKLIVFFTI